jgi:nitroreductase/NAD-dependent dihydropyrimidine dehydrogenase PreA subunit
MIDINGETCQGCGTCAAICPRYIPEMKEEGERKVARIQREREELCLTCGQCVSVCRSDSIRVQGFDPEGFSPVKPVDLNGDQLMSLIRHRRSVRRYKNRPVPREVLDQIVEAASLAPTGNGRQSVGLIIIDDPEKLKELSRRAFDFYEKADGMLKNPIARFFMKRKAGERMFGTLRDFVMPGMRWYIRWYREGRSDEIRRDCPALMLFNSSIKEPRADENCLLAATFAMLMAEALGVGNCYNGLLGPAINRVDSNREFVGLGPGREVFASLGLGYGKYKYRKSIPRKLEEVRYLE